MLRFIFLTLLVCSSFLTEAQKKKKYSVKNKKAIKAFEQGVAFNKLLYFQQATIELNKAIDLEPNFIEAYIVLGDIAYNNRKYQKSINFYDKAVLINPEFDKGLYYGLAEAQMEIMLYDDVIKNMKIYKEFELSKLSMKRADNMIKIAMFRKEMVANPVPFNPINLGNGVNVKWFEHSPTLTVDEQIIYFTRKLPTGGHYRDGSMVYDEDLFISMKGADGVWQKAKNLGKSINTEIGEGASAISPDGKYLFFTSCDRPGGMGSCDLYLAVRKGNNWVKPRNMGDIINTRYWDSQPSFGADGRTLYFVSNRPGGKGKKDIWMSKIGDDGQWTKPLSIPINTSKNEESPFIHPDGHTFYFSSDGLPGMGKRDLYKVKIDEEGNWGEPVNLGYPINSSNDEVSLSVSANGKRAYFASEREGGFGKWDLYQFDLPKEAQPLPVTYAKGKVYDAETQKPLKAKFEIIDLETGQQVVESYSDKETGKYLVTVPQKKNYMLNASTAGYLFFSENFEIEGEASGFNFDVKMKPIKEGQKVVLKNIFFETNKYVLKPESETELDKLVSFLNKNETLHIEIGGHTDNVGSKEYNQRLSENRAKSVYDYLVSKGISADRLQYKGYNFEQPIASNDTEEGRAKNRRTEFKVTKK